jgi:putative ABC transport system permease protein
MGIWKRIKAFGPWSRARLECDLEREIQNHLALEAQDSGDRKAFGNIALVKEDVREAWGWARLEQFARDIHYGLRQVRRNPSFSAIAIATLALGIGGVAAMFSAVDAVLIRPLPYPGADRLVTIWDDLSMARTREPKIVSTPFEWILWRQLNTVFTDLAATQPAQATLTGEGEPEQLPARKATWNLWNVLGVQPMLGRAFTEDEDTKSVRVAVISHGLWQRRFGGSPDVIGRKITLNDSPYEVIGVTPPGFYFLPSRDIDIWLPPSFPAWMRTNPAWHDALIVARLKLGITLEQAGASMRALTMQVTAKDFRGPHSAVITPLREELAGKTRSALIVLLCASAGLLLIACVNLANLLLSRGAVRRREVAVRAAIGAGRGRLVAQFLTESLVLSGLGAIAGLLLALPAMRFLESLAPETMGAVRLTLDWRVVAISAAAAIGSALTFGLAPALGGSRLALLEGLREGARGSAGARSHWFQHSLIVVEMALAVVLLTCGGLLLQTLQHLRQLDLGIRSEKLLTLESPLLRFQDFGKQVAFVEAELERIRAIPGVVNAGAVSRIPLTENGQATFYKLAGQPNEKVPDQVALFRVVSRDYLATIGAHLREGRFFGAFDRRSGTPVVIVNESFANRNFPGRSALGGRFQFGSTGDNDPWYTIVGVVKEIRDRGVTENLGPAAYLLHEQTQWGSNARPSGIVVRAAVEPESLVPAIRQAIWSVDKNQPIARVQTMQEIVDRQLSTPSQTTELLGAFAVLALLLALLLASIGLYGVLSYAVTQRTNEIGVRMALGATSCDILLSFGRRGLALTLGGLALGLALSMVAVRLIATLIYGFQPNHAMAGVAVSVILLAVAALACFVPARRASRLDPVVALQHE